jgi:hypothetical protein
MTGSRRLVQRMLRILGGPIYTAHRVTCRAGAKAGVKIVGLQKTTATQVLEAMRVQRIRYRSPTMRIPPLSTSTTETPEARPLRQSAMF